MSREAEIDEVESGRERMKAPFRPLRKMCVKEKEREVGPILEEPRWGNKIRTSVEGQKTKSSVDSWKKRIKNGCREKRHNGKNLS
mmetsp:Transcript_47783/g.94302  ORF Transcript_47783/g.94302 Transcript_47783/m.94302 type:complete len:85 (-) Transcript_47783:1035-1289(-)